jgi:hypothetical protein
MSSGDRHVRDRPGVVHVTITDISLRMMAVAWRQAFVV